MSLLCYSHFIPATDFLPTFSTYSSFLHYFHYSLLHLNFLFQYSWNSLVLVCYFLFLFSLEIVSEAKSCCIQIGKIASRANHKTEIDAKRMGISVRWDTLCDIVYCGRFADLVGVVNAMYETSINLLRVIILLWAINSLCILFLR